MLRKLSVFLAILLILSSFCTVNAGTDDALIKSATLGTLVSIDPSGELGGHQMRGFTASKDGKYLYGGFIQTYRHVSKYNAADGSFIAEYVPEVTDEGAGTDNNYPKGIATDNRGYLFVGLTHPETPYCWVLTCYDCVPIRCYDVTDVKNIVLNKDFGDEGVINYNDLTGSQADPGYLGVDTEGVIYLAYLKDGSSCSKGSTIAKIAADGKSIQLQADVDEAYGVCVAGDYVFVCTYAKADSCVYVLNKSDLSTVCTLKDELQATNLTGIFYAGDYLYVGDQGDINSGVAGVVHRSSSVPIKRSAEELAVVETEYLETKAPEEQTEPETDDAAEPTAKVTDKVTEKTAPSTKASVTNAQTTEKPVEKGEAPLPMWAIILIAVGAVVVVGTVVIVVLKKKNK